MIQTGDPTSRGDNNTVADPTERPIQVGELLLIDAGVFVSRYVSDLTRTFAVGKINHVLEDMYDTVLRLIFGPLKPFVPILLSLVLISQPVTSLKTKDMENILLIV